MSSEVAMGDMADDLTDGGFASLQAHNEGRCGDCGICPHCVEEVYAEKRKRLGECPVCCKTTCDDRDVCAEVFYFRDENLWDDDPDRGNADIDAEPRNPY